MPAQNWYTVDSWDDDLDQPMYGMQFDVRDLPRWGFTAEQHFEIIQANIDNRILTPFGVNDILVKKVLKKVAHCSECGAELNGDARTEGVRVKLICDQCYQDKKRKE